MKPIRYEKDVPVFTTRDIDDYGFPELYGYSNYQVIESRDLVLVTDFKMEQELDFRPIHRYSRLARFKKTLLNILGENGRVPDQVLTVVKTFIDPLSTDKWNDVRRILKHYKQRRYYDNIPFIVKNIQMGACFPQLNSEQIQQIIRDFQTLSDHYERVKHTFKRRYFPNIRFVTLKLLELHGIKPVYNVPLVRTTRKRKALSTLWTQLTG